MVITSGDDFQDRINNKKSRMQTMRDFLVMIVRLFQLAREAGSAIIWCAYLSQCPGLHSLILPEPGYDIDRYCLIRYNPGR